MTNVMDDDEVCSVVVDNGSGTLKAGFAGEDAPRVVFPSITGTPKHEIILSGLDTKDSYVGDEAQRRREILNLRRPMEHSVVTHWDAMEAVWLHMFHDELRVAPEDQGVLITETPRNPRLHREVMTEIMFEKFEVPAFYIAAPGILSTYASGRGTVITVDVGEGCTHIMNVYEGYSTPEAILRQDLGGAELTEALQTQLSQRAYNVGHPGDHFVVRAIKEKLCYVALDYEEELHSADCGLTSKGQYELPDGQLVTINTERFSVPETLFRPSLIGKDLKGLHQLVFDSIQRCPVDTRRDFYCNICLVGGSTMFPGLADRLEKELRALVPAAVKVRVIAPPERRSSVWIGGSILASLSTFQSMWVTRQLYEETGPYITHTKCPMF